MSEVETLIEQLLDAVRRTTGQSLRQERDAARAECERLKKDLNTRYWEGIARENGKLRIELDQQTKRGNDLGAMALRFSRERTGLRAECERLRAELAAKTGPLTDEEERELRTLLGAGDSDRARSALVQFVRDCCARRTRPACDHVLLPEASDDNEISRLWRLAKSAWERCQGTVEQSWFAAVKAMLRALHESRRKEPTP